MCNHLRCRVVLAVGALAVLVHAAPSQALRNVKVGEPIPPFSVKTANDETVDNSTYKGKVLLLLFVRAQHANSERILKTAQEILSANPDTKLRVLAVSTSRDSQESFGKLVKKDGLTFPIATDLNRKMYGDYGVLVAPTALLIDEKGILRYEQTHTPPGYAIRLHLHTDLLLGKINQEQLEARLAQVKSRKPKAEVSRDRRLTMARMLIEDEKLDEAVTLLTQLTPEQTSPRTAALLGDCYLRLGRVEEAAKCLEPFAELEPSPPGLKLALARLEVRRGDDEKAERYLLDALEKSPRKDRILFELGRLYERQDKPSKALDCYRRALEAIYGTNQ